MNNRKRKRDEDVVGRKEIGVELKGEMCPFWEECPELSPKLRARDLVVLCLRRRKGVNSLLPVSVFAQLSLFWEVPSFRDPCKQKV